MKHLSLIMSMLAAFALALSGCTESETARSLDRAEAVMEEHPDSALAILGAIPSADVNSSADRALHALLLTQAQIKNGHIVDNDSLINIAVRHYSDRDDSPRLMKSLFYKAQVEYNRGDMAAAIVPAIRARELATEFNDSYWRAKAAELMADIYSVTHYKSEAVKYTEEAAEHYKKAGKARNHLFALCDLAVVRSNDGVDDNKNIALLDSVRRIAINEPADTTLIVYADRTLFGMYVDSGRNDEAHRILEEMLSLKSHYFPDSEQYSYMSRLATNDGNDEEALQIIKTANDEATNTSQKVHVYVFYRDYHKSKGMSREAEAYTDSILTLQNTEVAAVLKQSVVSAQRDFFTARAEKEADKARLSAMTASALGILLAAVCIGFLLYYREKMRRKKAEIETMMLEAQSLSAQLDEKDESLQSAINELNKTRNDLKELSITVSDKDSLLKTQTLLTNSILEKRFQTLNALSKDYLTLTNQSSPRTGIVSDFKKELDIMANPESQAELERIVNNKHQGIITRLRNQLPKIKDQDIFFLTLIAAGVSRNAICLITKNKQANYYNKCSRLRRKIENSDSTDKQEFLDTIFK
jgi:tetratricopeptide (TPR) repeat protein